MPINTNAVAGHTLLSNDDKLFLALKYWRQYVTQKELAFEIEVSETNAKDTIFWVEDELIKSGKFTLPSKKALLDDESEVEVILIDATETPIQRPKKVSENGILERKNTIPLKTSWLFARIPKRYSVQLTRMAKPTTLSSMKSA